MFLDNPKKFKDWPNLRYDILFNGMTIIQAAQKYGVTTAGISQHLKKYPHIKQAYYARPWAERQLQFEFIPPECVRAREVIDDYYVNSYPPIYQFDNEHYQSAMQHREYCKSCQEYEKYQILKAEAPFRLDCPPISRLISHLRRVGEEIEKLKGSNDVEITEHLLVCNFCRAELNHFQRFTLEEIRPIIEKERKLIAKHGWREALDNNELQTIIQITADHPNLININIEHLSPEIKKFIKWRRFRKWVTQPSTI